MPSFRYAIAPHFQKQMSQVVGTVREPDSAGPLRNASDARSAAVDVAAAPAAIPVIFRNFRREREFITSSVIGGVLEDRAFERAAVDDLIVHLAVSAVCVAATAGPRGDHPAWCAVVIERGT